MTDEEHNRACIAAKRISTEGDLLEAVCSMLIKDAQEMLTSTAPNEADIREQQYFKIQAVLDLKSQIKNLAAELKDNTNA